METRFYFVTLIAHPFEPTKRIPPLASSFALTERTKDGEDVSGWLGIPDGVRRSLIKLEADTCIMSITAEVIDFTAIEASSIVKRIDLSKTVAEQIKTTVDLVRFGALPTDTAAAAIKKVCKGIDVNLETFFDRQKDPLVESK